MGYYAADADEISPLVWRAVFRRAFPDSAAGATLL